MKVVVFGGSGFLGSHVADVLTAKGDKVLIYDRKASPYLQDSQEMIVGDIMDSRGVETAVKGADVVYNFAGIADLEESRVSPLETIRQNVLGNTIILEACRKNGIKRFLFASSVYVYSNSGSFYRSSKHACELIIEDYRKASNLDFTIMRYGSLYGPRANRNNWIYKIIRQALLEKKITRKGLGEEIREYIHVLDAARISVEALDEQYANQYVIISGNQPLKIKDLLVMVKEMLSNEIQIEYTPPRHEEHYEVTPYSFNPRIAKKIVSSSYLDLGQGLLDMMERVHREISPQGKEQGSDIETMLENF